MNLSITKLDDLLYSKGFIADKYLYVEDNIIYIEIVDKNTFETFLLYIPSKYTFKPSQDIENLYKIKPIDTNKEDPFDEGQIEPLEIDEPIMEKEALEERYNKPISLDKQRYIKISKECFAQLKRYRYSIEELKYKFGILYQECLSVIMRDNHIETFLIKKYKGLEKRQLYIIFDLEMLYNKDISIISADVKKIKADFYRLLDKNQGMHVSHINMLLNTKSIYNMSSLLPNFKQKYVGLLYSYDGVLNKIVSSENTMNNKLKMLSKRISKSTGITQDQELTKERTNIEYELKKLIAKKEDILEKSLHLRKKVDNIFLLIDKINFDNYVMLGNIIENSQLLEELTSKF